MDLDSLQDMDLHVRCDRARKSASVYFISVFFSCSTLNRLIKKNFK